MQTHELIPSKNLDTEFVLFENGTTIQLWISELGDVFPWLHGWETCCRSFIPFHCRGFGVVCALWSWVWIWAIMESGSTISGSVRLIMDCFACIDDV